MIEIAEEHKELVWMSLLVFFVVLVLSEETHRRHICLFHWHAVVTSNRSKKVYHFPQIQQRKIWHVLIHRVERNTYFNYGSQFREFKPHGYFILHGNIDFIPSILYEIKHIFQDRYPNGFSYLFKFHFYVYYS